MTTTEGAAASASTTSRNTNVRIESNYQVHNLTSNCCFWKVKRKNCNNRNKLLLLQLCLLCVLLLAFNTRAITTGFTHITTARKCLQKSIISTASSSDKNRMYHPIQYQQKKRLEQTSALLYLLLSSYSGNDGDARVHDDDRTKSTDCFTVSGSLAESSLISRRNVFQSSGAAIVSATVSSFAQQQLHPSKAYAATSSKVTSSVTTQPDRTNADEAKITHKVYFDVRISRQDGTFYVRDDLPDVFENQVYYGKLVFGLFGSNAPNHVEKFLSYIDTSQSIMDDNPFPSYSRSLFTKYDQANVVLTAGVIPSLEASELNGNNVLKYGGRILPASLWIEKGNPGPRITHIGKGLLTHKLFDSTPVFGITTRKDTTELDGSSFVFGRILLDDSSNDFLSRISNIPTYSIERPAAADDNVVEDAAELVFNAQRTFFRSAAKSFGDTRVGKVYEGKLLRRVEVTKVGLIK